MQNFDCAEIEKIIGYTFQNKQLLKTAFTHSSFSNEHKVESNERLEFLGDSILSFVIAEEIFKRYHKSEGELTKIRASLVSEKSLAFVSKQLGLDKFLIVGAGLFGKTPTDAMIADSFEALLASIYLDSGIQKARKFLLQIFESSLGKIKKSGVPDSFKSQLQEKFKNAKIVYDTKSSGEGEEKYYTAQVYINKVACGTGQAGKKRDAEELAAKQALENLSKK